jgi:hypothetical protein
MAESTQTKSATEVTPTERDAVLAGVWSVAGGEG